MTIVDLTTAWFHLHLQLSDAALIGLWPLVPRILRLKGPVGARPRVCPLAARIECALTRPSANVR